MNYSELVEVYESLASTTKRLEKTAILAKFLKDMYKHQNPAWIYLLKGRVLPDYDSREFGISSQIVIKALSSAWGISNERIVQSYRKIGDLGDIAMHFSEKKKQSALFTKKLLVKKVFDNLSKIMNIEGKGSIDKKIGLISELLGSAKPLEAKYIIRTILGDLRVGVADATIVDSIALAFYPDNQSEMTNIVQDAQYLANDFSRVFESAGKSKQALKEIGITPGKPLLVMLPIKVNELSEAFDVCGKPAAIEHKYDGFRMLIHKNGKELTFFTRKLENVTTQFPDVAQAVKSHVKGESFIIDCEVVGYNPKTLKHMPFEAISQRIRRKYHIDKLIKELPVEINVFDIIYHDGKNLMHTPFIERRKILVKVVKEEKWIIRPSFQLITDNEKEAEAFYKNALKIGEEGIMIKKLDAPYHPGRLVGYMVKLKPLANDLDFVITGAEYGSGKRAGLLTSYIVSCRDGHEFKEVGMVSSGLKEKSEEGTSYDEMTQLLKPLITKEEKTHVKVKPKIIVSVTYQNIQESPSYSSGFAMRFPRITHFRPDRSTHDIATLDEIKKEARKQR